MSAELNAFMQSIRSRAVLLLSYGFYAPMMRYCGNTTRPGWSTRLAGMDIVG